MNIIKCSGGNDSIALLQWTLEQELEEVTVVHNDTGWAATWWAGRMEQIESWCSDHGFSFVTLQSEGMFQLAKRKKSWPSRLSQFCTTHLKIEPYQAWIEEFDPKKEATCIAGIRREESERRSSWPEWVEESEKDLGRSAWFPLVTYREKERNELIYKAGFTPLPHRSLECNPCIYASREDIKQIDDERIDQIAAMEQELGYTKNGKLRTFFRPYKKGGARSIRQAVDWAWSKRGQFDPDQGLMFGCDSGFCGV